MSTSDDVVVDVADHRTERTGLAVAASALGAGAGALFVGALVSVVSDARFPIGCDDFTGTSDGSAYPSGQTCPPRSSSAGTYAQVGLALLALGAAVGVAAAALPPIRIQIGPAVSTKGASAGLSLTF